MEVRERSLSQTLSRVRASRRMMWPTLLGIVRRFVTNWFLVLVLTSKKIEENARC